MYQKFLKRFFILAAVFLLAAAGLVFVFDPFFHYHEPISPLKKVLTKKEYQCIGSIRNFDYDSLIVGSSTAENFNNGWFDEAFGANSIKAIKSSAVTAQLDYYIEAAYETHEIQNVFYSLDLFALSGDPDIQFPDESLPLYLYDENPFNDVNYVLNKDVIFEDIPYMIAETFLDDYDEGNSYNWSQYKVFSKEEALSHYERPESVSEEVEASDYQEMIDRNVDILERMVKEHPETEFYIFYPPYSLLWWDNMIRTGQLEQSLYAARASMERLMGYENVKLYYFQNEEEIILNLDLYMDPIHFSDQINQRMVEEMKEGNYLITEENYEEELAEMEAIAGRIREAYESLT